MYFVRQPCTTSSVAFGTFRAASHVVVQRRTFVPALVLSTYHSPDPEVESQSLASFTRPYREGTARLGSESSTFSLPSAIACSSLALTFTSHGNTTCRILMSAFRTLSDGEAPCSLVTAYAWSVPPAKAMSFKSLFRPPTAST